MMPEPAASTTILYRQIRAVYDEETITVYQAYSEPIASAAVVAQRLDASPLFRLSRMTWIKPSWCWMLYRAGYSLKDAGQARILAIKLTRAGFEEMLRSAELTHTPDGKNLEGAMAETTEEGAVAENEAKHSRHLKKDSIRVQWDPERSPRLGKLDYRSIQIGIPGGQRAGEYVNNWITGIEDVTERALALKTALDADKTVSTLDLIERGLVPIERPYPTPVDIMETLHMTIQR